MMKKILSIMLTICMLMSMVIVPISVQATEAEDAYEASILGNGSYYKFTFGADGDRFQYTVGNNKTDNTTGQHSHKENTFYPLWTNSMYFDRLSWDYKTVNDAEGNSYDVMEIKNRTNGFFTPLTTEGKPFEMKPGVKYAVNVEYFNPIACSGSALYIGSATTNKKETTRFSGQYWTDSGTLATSSYMYPYLLYRSSKRGPVSGDTFDIYAPGDGVVSSENPMNLTCIQDGCGTKSLNLYRKDTAIIGIPTTDVATLNETTQSYTINVPNGDTTIEANNYLTLWFETGNTTIPSSSGHVYSPADTTLPEAEFTTWQIVSIEVYETANVTFVKDGVETVVPYRDGAEIEYETLEAKYGTDYVWSLEEDRYVEVPAKAYDGLKVYAIKTGNISFENYKPMDYASVYNTLDTAVSEDVAYTGTHSMRYRNYNKTILTEEPDEWENTYTSYYQYNSDPAIDAWELIPQADEAPAFEAYKYASSSSSNHRSLGNIALNIFEGGGVDTTFKISFKYLATNKNTTEVVVVPFMSQPANIWSVKGITYGQSLSEYKSSGFTIPAGSTDGQWRTAEIVVTFNLNSYSDSKSLMQLKVFGESTVNTNEIYFDDITVIKDYVNIPSLTLNNVYNPDTEAYDDNKVLEEAGTYPLTVPPAPEGKYFMGWYTEEDGGEAVTTSTVTVAEATGAADAAVDLYARYGDYVDNKTYTFDYTTKPAINGIAYMNDTTYSTTINEDGFNYYTKALNGEGLVLGRGTYEPGGYGMRVYYKSSSGSIAQPTTVTEGMTVYDSTADVAEGTYKKVGWGSGYDSYVIRDEKGVAAVPNANTKYVALVTYKKIGEGDITLTMTAGRKLATINAAYNSNNIESSVSASALSLNSTNGVGISEEFKTHAFTFTTGSYADGEVPVLSLKVQPTAFWAKRIAGDAVTSGTSTYYPYELVGIPKVLIKEVKILEVAENSGVAFLHVDGKIISVEGEAGTDITVDPATLGVTAPEEGNVYYWYTDEDCTKEATLTFTSGVVNLYAKQGKNPYLASTLGQGGYYKFTYGEGQSFTDYKVWYKNAADQGEYEPSYQKTWKGNKFYPAVSPIGMHYHSYAAERKEITVKGGNTYSVLEVASTTDIALTPLTTSGQPYELMPGKSYKVRVKMFVPREDTTNSSYVSLGNNTTVNTSYTVGNFTNTITNKSQSVSYPYASDNLSTIAGDHYACNFADGTYNEETVFGNCLGTHGTSTCDGTGNHKERWNKVYVDKILTINVPAAGEGGVFTYDEANNAYSAVLTDTASKEYNMNNYLTLYLGGGNANGYVSNADKGFYGSAGVNTSDTAPNTFQIVSIEVWQAGFGSVNLHVDGKVISVEGKEGAAIDTNAIFESGVEALEEGYVYNWYTDEACTKEATLTFSDGIVDLYAKVEKNAYEKSILGNSYKFTFGEDAYNNYKVWTRNSFQQGLAATEYRKEWKGNTFLPFWGPTNSHSSRANMTANLEEITVMGNKSYNVLEVTASNDVVLTPLTSGGQPYELTPGKSYDIRVKMFVPREDCWNNSYFSLGNNVTNFGDSNADWPANGANTSHLCPYRSDNLSTIAGNPYACNFADGTYNEETELGFCLGAHGEYGCNPAYKNNHTQKWTKVYVDKTVTINVPDTVDNGGVFVYDAETKSYSGTYKVDDKEYKLNNYLTMYLGGGDANKYLATDEGRYGIYGSENADITGTAYNTYQIVSIEVYEKGAVGFAPNGETSIMRDAKDGHTYKVDFSYVATNMDSDVSYNFGTANPYNAADLKSLTNTEDFVIEKEKVKPGKKYNVTRYFTVDLAGGINDLTELGSDYHIDDSCDELYMYFTQDGANNDLAISDFSITDLGEVVGTGGAAILIDPNVTGNKQAIRYFFNYTTNDGSVLKMDGKEFNVVARGFIYANGTLVTEDEMTAGSGRYFGGITLNNNNNPYKLSESTPKESGFDSCWEIEAADEEGAYKMTFSTYVKGFKEDDQRKLMVRGYVTVKDPVTNETFTVYSDTINRSVMSIKALGGSKDARSLVWAEEFNNATQFENSSFKQNYKSSSDKSSLGITQVGGFGEDKNLNIEDGKLVFKTISDGNTTTYAQGLTTYDKMTFRYGYLEMRAKVPSVKGVISAFWLRSGNFTTGETPFGEIDIFEVNGTIRGDSAGTVETAFHKWLGNENDTGGGDGHCNGGNFTNTGANMKTFNPDEYHTFGMEWTPETIIFYVDGEEYYRVDMTEDICGHDENDDEVFDHLDENDCFNNETQQYFIVLGSSLFNSVDHSNWGDAGEAQYVDEDNRPNAEYCIDYVRLYQNDSMGESVNKK